MYWFEGKYDFVHVCVFCVWCECILSMKEMRKIFCVKQRILSRRKPRTTLDEYETLTEFNFLIRKFKFESPRRFSQAKKKHTQNWADSPTKRIFFAFSTKMNLLCCLLITKQMLSNIKKTYLKIAVIICFKICMCKYKNIFSCVLNSETFNF